MVIYELLFWVVVIFLISLLFTRDIFSPSALICESYILAILCAIYKIDAWGIALHYNTLTIILVGLLCFVIPSILIQISYTKKYATEKSVTIEEICIEKNNIRFITLISFSIAIVYFFFFFKALNSFSADNVLYTFSQKMELYRERTQFQGVKYIPTIVNFLSKFCRAAAFINVYILINNMLVAPKNYIKNLGLYMPGILIYVPMTLSTGGRFDLISFFISIIIMFVIMYRKILNKKIGFKKLITIIMFIIGILLLFSASRTLVGRVSKNSTLNYITYYFGGSIEIFDMYMQESVEEDFPFGKELFSGIRKFLTQIHFLETDQSPNNSMKFRVSDTGVLIGNVYTAFRKMHHDYGILGVILFQTILSIIFSNMYYKIIAQREFFGNEIYLRIIVYSAIVFCLVLHSFSEFFFSTILSFNYIVLFIMMSVIKFMYLKVKIRGIYDR